MPTLIEHAKSLVTTGKLASAPAVPVAAVVPVTMETLGRRRDPKTQAIHDRLRARNERPAQ